MSAWERIGAAAASFIGEAAKGFGRTSNEGSLLTRNRYFIRVTVSFKIPHTLDKSTIFCHTIKTGSKMAANCYIIILKYYK